MATIYKNTVRKQTEENKWEVQHQSETSRYSPCTQPICNNYKDRRFFNYQIL